MFIIMLSILVVFVCIWPASWLFRWMIVQLLKLAV